MQHAGPVIVALSGGVDSAVAALSLLEAGRQVEGLHMTNWEDDDGYCAAASDFRDARRTADAMGIRLHRVNFSAEYQRDVFVDFVASYRRGETPNPDVLCNRHIKFGAMLAYARRLGADWLATGHYARVAHGPGPARLLRACDGRKDQSYFLHAVPSGALEKTLFPVGEMTKSEVRARAREVALPVADKRDSTGICFIGERPFGDFLGRFIADDPGAVVTTDGETVGRHRGLAFYTLGQRQGLAIGGRRGRPGEPWFVAGKCRDRNELVVVQGHDHPLLYRSRLVAVSPAWLGFPPDGFAAGAWIRASAKTRYRQPDRPCRFRRLDGDAVEVIFDTPERAVTPGQYVVFYSGERCLGGARIDSTDAAEPCARAVV